MNLDIQTLEHVAGALSKKPKMREAEAYVRQMATTERLRDEQFPQRDYPVVMFALVIAVLCMAGAVLS